MIIGGDSIMSRCGHITREMAEFIQKDFVIPCFRKYGYLDEIRIQDRAYGAKEVVQKQRLICVKDSSEFKVQEDLKEIRKRLKKVHKKDKLRGIEALQLPLNIFSSKTLLDQREEYHKLLETGQEEDIDDAWVGNLMQELVGENNDRRIQKLPRATNTRKKS